MFISSNTNTNNNNQVNIPGEITIKHKQHIKMENKQKQQQQHNKRISIIIRQSMERTKRQSTSKVASSIMSGCCRINNNNNNLILLLAIIIIISSMTSSLSSIFQYQIVAVDAHSLSYSESNSNQADQNQQQQQQQSGTGGTAGSNGSGRQNGRGSNGGGGGHSNGGSANGSGGGGGGGNQNRCQSGWMWFNNKCWVTTHSRRDFIHAVDLCKKMYNSTLPTIHSEEENEFLRQNIELTNSPIWLYARHNHQYNKTRWLDKTPVNYTRWDAGQPSDKSSLVCIKTEDSWYMKKAEPVDGQTECVSFWEDAKWGTQVGCQVLLPVVCEKKLTPISRFSQNQSGGENGGGPNGTISSQFEQQQMYNPISGSSSNFMMNSNNFGAIYLLTILATTSLGFISSSSSSFDSTSSLKFGSGSIRNHRHMIVA